MLGIRLLFALAVTYVSVLLMADGQFGAAAFVIAAGIWVRRAADGGRFSQPPQRAG
jgi:hypothetical protein